MSNPGNSPPPSSSELATGIVIITLPDTPDDDFQTPPEHHQPLSQTSTNAALETITALAVIDPEEMPLPVVDSGKVRFSVKSRGGIEEDNDILNVDKYVTEKDVEINLNDSQKEDARHVFDEMPVRGNEENVNREKRKLSVRDEVDNDEYDKHETFKATLNHVLGILAKEGKEGVKSGGGEVRRINFIETAKRRGMTFPRPRWWSSEHKD